MKSLPWVASTAALAAVAVAFGFSSCKKQAPAASAPEPTAAPTETASASPHAAPAGATAGSSGQAVAPRGDVVAVGSNGAAKVAAVTGKTVADTASYTVTLAAPATVAKGAEATVTVQVTPKKGYHLNQEFPTKLTVKPPAGVKVKKGQQGKSDAVAFNEQRGAWAVQFTAGPAGSEAFAGALKFAVCTATSCDPQKQALGWTVKVE